MQFNVQILLWLSVLVGSIWSTKEHQSAYHSVLGQMNIDPHSNMHEMYPKLKQINMSEIENCYSSNVGSRELDFFNNTVVDIVEGYFSEIPRLINSDNAVSRIQALVGNLETIVDLVHECASNPGTDRSKVGLTSMSAYPYEEYLKFLNPTLSNRTKTDGLGSRYGTDCDYRMDINELPENFNWKQQGKVTPVKNQGECGSCYIFSAVGAIESQYLIRGNGRLILSEQAVLNCFVSGCNGGWMDWVWDYIHRKGATSEELAPYLGHQEQCRRYPLKASLATYCFHEGNYNDDQLRSIIYKFGPSIGAVDARSNAFQHLKGVFRGPCGTELSHAILTVGYSEETWLIKNSWGVEWGDGGYFELPRNMNKCGINAISGVPYLRQHDW